VWFRGRTVGVLVAATALIASVATYAWFEFGANPSSNAQGGLFTSDPIVGLQQKDIDKLNKALELIQNRYMRAADHNKLIDGAVQGLVESLHDPYSVYKTAEEADKFNDALQGAFTGIGADLRVENGDIVVESTIRGSPAERAGLQPKDILLSVNGEKLHGLKLSEAISKIRGPKGTKAKLKVQRQGAAEPLDLELVRDRIDLGSETVHSEITPEGIGHLWINQFNNVTSNQVFDEVKAMEAKGLKALVIDVRDNPGGLLQSVIEVANQFVAKGKPIVAYEYKDGKQMVEKAADGANANKTYPLFVLMNKGSASAAEILAGALKQSANAVLVGTTTYGKGTVQVPFNDELGDGSMVKLTVYKWLLPDGTWINEKGIEPDIQVAQPDYFLASRLPRDIVLKYDMTSEAVKNLQNILAGVGFPADRKDGYFSEATKIALMGFQAQQSLAETGEVDATTADRLEEKLYANLHDNPAYDAQWQAALAASKERINSAP
jgi:carboxyl-terminal processing protease